MSLHTDLASTGLTPETIPDLIPGTVTALATPLLSDKSEPVYGLGFTARFVTEEEHGVSRLGAALRRRGAHGSLPQTLWGLDHPGEGALPGTQDELITLFPLAASISCEPDAEAAADQYFHSYLGVSADREQTAITSRTYLKATGQGIERHRHGAWFDYGDVLIFDHEVEPSTFQIFLHLRAAAQQGHLILLNSRTLQVSSEGAIFVDSRDLPAQTAQRLIDAKRHH